MKVKTKKAFKRNINKVKKAAKKVVVYKKRLSKKPAVKVIKRKFNKAYKVICEVLGGLAVLVFIFIGIGYFVPQINMNVLGDTTSSTPPAIPSKLAAKVRSSTVTITWEDTSEIPADKYVIYRYDDASGQYIEAPKNQIISEFSKKYISGENDSNKTYLYRVGGVRYYFEPGKQDATEVRGVLSEPISIKIPNIKVPSAPKNFRAKVKNSLITFSWSGTADWYKLEKYDEILKKYVLESPLSGITALSFSNRAYEPGKTYKFRLSSNNNVYKQGVISKTIQSIKYATLTVRVPFVGSPSAPTKIKYRVNDEIIRITLPNTSKYTYLGPITTDISGVDGYELMVYSDTFKEWVPLDYKDYKFESERVIRLLNHKSGESKRYKIRAFKKIYDSDSREITNLFGLYSNPILITAP